jgi:hypothetical protein
MKKAKLLKKLKKTKTGLKVADDNITILIRENVQLKRELKGLREVRLSIDIERNDLIEENQLLRRQLGREDAS